MSIDTLNDRLPHVNVSYGHVLDKQYTADMYQVVPKGSPCLLWYTYCKGMNVCYLLYLAQNNKSIHKIEKVIASFNSELCYGQGTLLSGVLLHYNNLQVFTIMDIHVFKGWSISDKTFIDKFKYITCLLANHTRANSYVTSQLIVASAIVLSSYEDALMVSDGLPYPIYCITLMDGKDTKVKGKYIYSKNISVRFRIQPDIQCDIYYLHTDTTENIYGIALIPDYKTSVMMNGFFRNVKENNNLDLIEESDEENEEIVNPIPLKLSIVMECMYDRKFKRWKPIQKSTLPLTNIQEIQHIEKNIAL
jgi:hypothetical protein